MNIFDALKQPGVGQGLLGMGANMLAASNQSGATLGSTLGQGLLSYQQSYAQAKEKAKKEERNKRLKGLLGDMPPERSGLIGAMIDKENYEGALTAMQPSETKPTSEIQEYEFAKSQGYSGSFIDYQNMINKSKGTTINNNVGQDAPYKLPSGYMFKDVNDYSKGVTSIPGMKDTTEAAKNKTISSTALQTIDDFKSRLTNQQGDIVPLGPESIQGIPNIFKSAEGQKISVLQNDLTDMVGRLRSGGAINKDEEDRFLSFIPKFGDKPETIEFKLQRLNEMFGSLQGNLQGNTSQVFQQTKTLNGKTYMQINGEWFEQ